VRRRAPPETAAHAGPQAIGADQCHPSFFRHLAPAERGDGHAIAAQLEVLDTRAEADGDSGVGINRVEQHGLQVTAMDHPIRRAITLLGCPSERDARKHAAGARIHDVKLLRHDDVLPQRRFEAERDQKARGVGRELDAGACLFQPICLIKETDVKSSPSECQGGGEPANARASDDGGACGAHLSCRFSPSARQLARILLDVPRGDRG